MSMDEGSVRLSSDDEGVATLLLDRSNKLNALTIEMIAELRDRIDEVRKAGPRVVLVRSAGDRAFCVGADIRQFSAFDPEAMWRTWIADGHRALRELAELPQPTIAVVQGAAFGGGLELALSCDLRVASRSAKFALPETGIGTIPGWGGTESLTRAIGRARANEMILTRRQIGSEKALDWGLVNESFAPEDLEQGVRSLVKEILGGAPLAQQTSKQLIRAAGEGASAAVLEGLASGFTASAPDFQEGLSAFMEKRAPQFRPTGRRELPNSER